MEWIEFIIKAILGGIAAIGFGILFNVPPRVLINIFVLGMVGVFLKVFLHDLGLSIILSSFVGALVIGVLSIQAAHSKHAPPLVFSIPAVIPMVPGLFTYRAMLGIIKLTNTVGPDYQEVLNSTINNGLNAGLILMCLAVGVGFPNFLPGSETSKNSVMFISTSKK